MSDIFLYGDLQQARIGPGVMPTTIATLYTFGEPLLVMSALFTNPTAGAITGIVLHLVPSGSSPATTTQIVPGINVPGNDVVSYTFADGIPANPGDTLRYMAGDAGVNITVVVSRRNR